MFPGLQYFGCKGACWSYGMGTRKNDKHQSLTRACTNQTSRWLVHSCSTLVHGRVTGKHGLTRLTMAQSWGKPPPSPLQYTLCLVTGPTPKCHFVSGFPSGSPEILNVGTFMTLKGHKFVCKPLIEMRSEAKLQPLSRAFQQYVAHHLHARKSG